MMINQHQRSLLRKKPKLYLIGLCVVCLFHVGPVHSEMSHDVTGAKLLQYHGISQYQGMQTQPCGLLPEESMCPCSFRQNQPHVKIEMPLNLIIMNQRQTSSMFYIIHKNDALLSRKWLLHQTNMTSFSTLKAEGK